ncbi:MAG: VOC family protein [Ilumatobacteraceae bacterium]
MSIALHSITFDAADPIALATFWSKALDHPVDDGATESFAQLTPSRRTAGMMFIKVPEGKTAKNRVHLDLSAADREAEVARLVGLGATRRDDHDELGIRWTVLQDVEGNELCVGEAVPVQP